LSRIYSSSESCGATYCDGDPPERIARVKQGWQRKITLDQQLRARSTRELLDLFKAEIRADRYFAAHLFGDLKDPRGVDVLIPLLNDDEVNSVVPWALAEIGDRRAIEPLIGELSRSDPSKRVIAISALEKLKAREALPRLRELLQDDARSSFGSRLSVAEAARRAIAVISS
jgi:hypothetical protein